MTAERRPAGGERTLESVWDYPLPPVAERCALHAQVILNGFLIADASDTVRVLQTGLPPSYYFSPHTVQEVYLRPNGHHTHCVYKGRASYYDVVVGDRFVRNGAWTYHDPYSGFELIADHVAFYPSRMDACLIEGQPARIDPADESGGWVTPDIIGLSRGYPRVWDRSEDT